jgi:hypothetical protein
MQVLPMQVKPYYVQRQVNFINVDGLSIGVDASVEEGDSVSSSTARLLMFKSF